MQSEANKRGMASNLNDPKTAHNTKNNTMPNTAKTAPAMPARVKLRPFNGGGGFVILSPHNLLLIISKVCSQHSPELRIKRGYESRFR